MEREHSSPLHKNRVNYFLNVENLNKPFSLGIFSIAFILFLTWSMAVLYIYANSDKFVEVYNFDI